MFYDHEARAEQMEALEEKVESLGSEVARLREELAGEHAARLKVEAERDGLKASLAEANAHLRRLEWRADFVRGSTALGPVKCACCGHHMPGQSGCCDEAPHDEGHVRGHTLDCKLGSYLRRHPEFELPDYLAKTEPT